MATKNKGKTNLRNARVTISLLANDLQLINKTNLVLYPVSSLGNAKSPAVAVIFGGLGVLGAVTSGLALFALGSSMLPTHSRSLPIPSAFDMSALAPTAVASDNPNISLYIV